MSNFYNNFYYYDSYYDYYYVLFNIFIIILTIILTNFRLFEMGKNESKIISDSNKKRIHSVDFFYILT